MPNPISLTSKGLFKAISTVGSLFIKRGPDGKINVAVAPLSLLIALATAVTCTVQKSEPFSVCVQSTINSLKELVYAN